MFVEILSLRNTFKISMIRLYLWLDAKCKFVEKENEALLRCLGVAYRQFMIISK